MFEFDVNEALKPDTPKETTMTRVDKETDDLISLFAKKFNVSKVKVVREAMRCLSAAYEAADEKQQKKKVR